MAVTRVVVRGGPGPRTGKGAAHHVALTWRRHGGHAAATQAAERTAPIHPGWIGWRRCGTRPASTGGSSWPGGHGARRRGIDTAAVQGGDRPAAEGGGAAAKQRVSRPDKFIPK
uniref:Uncharacterized protein n=1 Tax=Oryza sativa subsp. japonica TaxID=39947 RepID=Q84SU4_ORYSJ|nr:hypothetical protein Os03g45020 [Oryza sativa Japonica Group]